MYRTVFASIGCLLLASIAIAKESATIPYSSKKMTFDNYVIDSDGKIRGVIDGTLRDRATVEELTKILNEIEAEKR